MKKRVLMVLLICLLSCACLFAANKQKIYSVDDDIYSEIADLYLITGHALPSTTGPWSGAELLGMVEKLDIDKIPESLLEKYYSIVKELNEAPEYKWKGISASFNHELNLQLAFHTNNTGNIKRTDSSGNSEFLFVGRDNWASDYIHNVAPFYALDWETWVQDNIYADVVLGLYNSYNGDGMNSDFGSKPLSSNIIAFQNFKFEGGFIDANFPYRGFFSAGSDHWSFELGRDKISWGAGKTGNMTISNNLMYHNMARFTAFSDKYKYTFLTSFFPHPMNYNNGVRDSFDGSDETNYDTIDSTSYFRPTETDITTGQIGLNGLSMYMGHRIEGRFLKDKLNLALTEAVMYESASNHLDLITLSPMYVFHNAYIPYYANSTLCFEFDITPFKGFNIYGQALLDEFAIPVLEDSSSPTASSTPNRYGLLGGITYTVPMFGGVFKANAEYAQTDPYTYLKSEVDFVVPIRLWSSAVPGTIWNEYFLGYTYGCDARVFNLCLDYKKGPLKVNFNFLDVFHGTHDQWTISKAHTGGTGDEWVKTDKTCTTKEDGSKRWTTDSYTKNAVENTLDFSLGASYGFFEEKLTVYGQADFVIVKNAFNVANQNDKDFQFILGAKYSF